MRETYPVPGQRKRSPKAILAGLAAVGSLVAVAGCGGGQTQAQAPPQRTTSTATPNKAPAQPSIPPSIGYDASYPQADLGLPTPTGLAAVVDLGVNGGFANNWNAALRQQYEGAKRSTGNKLSKIAFYLWAANPSGEFQEDKVTDWPHKGTNPVGTCNSSDPDGPACSFQYGFNMGTADMSHIKSLLGVTSFGTVYTDVEVGSGWEIQADNGTPNAQAQIDDAAALGGYALAIRNAGGKVGLYSTAYQLNEIAGDIATDPLPIAVKESLLTAQDWVATGGTEQDARNACSESLTPGANVRQAQFIKRFPAMPASWAGYDYDWYCETGVAA